MATSALVTMTLSRAGSVNWTPGPTKLAKATPGALPGSVVSRKVAMKKAYPGSSGLQIIVGCGKL